MNDILYYWILNNNFIDIRYKCQTIILYNFLFCLYYINYNNNQIFHKIICYNLIYWFANKHFNNHIIIYANKIHSRESLLFNYCIQFIILIQDHHNNYTYIHNYFQSFYIILDILNIFQIYIFHKIVNKKIYINNNHHIK